MNRRFNSEEWYVWEQNASPMLLIMTLNPSFQNLREYLGSSLFNSLVIFETDSLNNYQAKWLFRLSEGRALGQKMVDMLLCPPYMVAYNSGLEVAEERLVKKAHEIQNNYTSYALDKIPNIFEEFVSLYHDYYKLAAFTEPVQWHTEQLISKYVSNHYKGEIAADEAVKALLTIEMDSYAIDILSDLCACATALDDIVSESEDFKIFIDEELNNDDFANTVADFVFDSDNEVFAQLKIRLENHSICYYWKKNNYHSTLFVSPKDVLIELLEATSFEVGKSSSYYQNLLKTTFASKEKYLSIKSNVFSELPTYYQNVVSIANAVGATLIDCRKKNVMTCNSAFDAIFSIVSDKTGYNIEDIHLLVPQEFRYFVENPHSYKERFTQRRKLFICMQSDFPLVDELIEPVDVSTVESILSWYVSPTTEPYIAEGDVAESSLEKLNHSMNFFESSETATNTLQGVTAFFDKSYPVIEGIARVIKNPKNEELQTGEILVAPSTTPDFIDAINKSNAIVTDWGGQTSHAAMVSRELEKPCIIGTNFASQLLKTGQKIKIDFTTASIEIIE
jgi:phosphohistidine swiveling domain-containing protein